MRRRGHTVFHDTLQGIKAQIGTSGAAQEAVTRALGDLDQRIDVLDLRVAAVEQAGSAQGGVTEALKDLGLRIDVLDGRVAALEQAGTTPGGTDVLADRLAVCEGRLAVIEKLVGAPPRPPVRAWPWRVILGTSPSNRRFVVSEEATAGLRAAGYETLEQILDEPGSDDLAPWEAIHARWAEAYGREPSHVPEPPDVGEVEEFYRICQELLRPAAT